MENGGKTAWLERSVRIGFLAIVVLLPIVRPLSFYVGSLRVSATDVLFPVVLAAWLALIATRRLTFRVESFHIIVAVFAAAVILSAIFSTDPQRSLLKLAGEYYLFALAFVAYSLVRDLSFAKQLSIAWLAGTGITILASLAGFVLFYLGYKTQADNYFLSHAGSLPAGNYPRIHALLANANMMCNYLNVSAMFALLAAELGWIKRWLGWLLAVAVAVAAFFTLSPGIGGIILSVGLWMSVKCLAAGQAAKSRVTLAAALMGAMIFLTAAGVSPDTPNTDRQITIAGVTIEPSVRVLVWNETFQTMARYPLLGVGTGIDPVKMIYTTVAGQGQILSDAHNMYLSVAAQYGIVGFAAFALLLFFLIRRFRFDLSDERRAIVTAASCAIIGAFLYQGLTGSFEDARHLWILIGVFAGAAAERATTIDT